MDYRGINRRGAIFIIALLLIIISLVVWWLNRKSSNTGNTVPVTAHPYHQVAYTKLAHQGGNFVGDIYLLDVMTGATTQLTQGGDTSAVAWLSSDTLGIIARPRASRIIPFALNVNQGTMRETIGFDNAPALVNRSPDGQRLVTELITSNSWESQGYTLIDIIEGQAQTSLSLPNAASLPVWLPDSQSILYDTAGGEVCLHHIDSNTRDCLVGTDSALSPSITPILVAYTSSINQTHQVCVARIANGHFNHTQCYDQNEAQFTNLLWRP